MTAASCSTVLTVAKLFQHKLSYRVTCLSVTISNVVIMVVCYTLVIITMLQKARDARRHVGALNETHSPISGPSVTPNVNTVASSTTTADTTARTKKPTLRMNVSKTTANQANSYKDLLLLFTITIVFLACWMPVWLSFAGLYVSVELQKMYILNSLVNPFIYSVVSAMFRDDMRLFYRKTRLKLSMFT